MQMTKRDVADIVLVWMVFHFVMQFLMSLIRVGMYFIPYGLMPHGDEAIAIVLEVLYFFVLLLLIYVLLFKRTQILSLVFPDADVKQISVSSELHALTSYAFWIRLFGIYLLLTHGISFLSNLATNAAFYPHVDEARYWIKGAGSGLISAVLAALVVWKADWIAEKLGKMVARPRQPADNEAENQ
jgi:hypothetical protein